MSNKFVWWWAAWIGFSAGLFCFLYSLLPIASYNYIWMMFVSLPIYFGAGAPIKEFPHYFLSLLAGVTWGFLYLFGIGTLVSAGFAPNVSTGIVVAIFTMLCVGIHTAVIGKTLINKVPIIFGSLAMVFSQGGKNLLAITITLTIGLILGVVISEGGKVIDKLLKDKTPVAVAA